MLSGGDVIAINHYKDKQGNRYVVLRTEDGWRAHRQPPNKKQSPWRCSVPQSTFGAAQAELDNAAIARGLERDELCPYCDGVSQFEPGKWGIVCCGYPHRCFDTSEQAQWSIDNCDHLSFSDWGKWFAKQQKCLGLDDNGKDMYSCKAYLVRTLKAKCINLPYSEMTPTELLPHIEANAHFNGCDGCENHWYSAGHKHLLVVNGIGPDTKVPCEPMTHYCRPGGGILHKIHSGLQKRDCCPPGRFMEEELTMSIEYPSPGPEACPLYGGAREKKGGGHFVTCGTYDRPCADDGAYIVQIKRCSGEAKVDCRLYLLHALKTEYGHAGGELNGLSDAEIKNMYDGHRIKAEAVVDPTEQDDPPADENDAGALAELPAGDDVSAEPRSLAVITAEVNYFKAQTAQSVIEIGRRLHEAKAQLKHGEWLEWLKSGVYIETRTAQRFMQLADEYSNASPVTHLGYSKLLTLLAVPADEREQFVATVHEVDGQQKTVDEMSKRELEQVIKERDAAEQRAEEEKRQRIAANKRCDLLEQDKQQAYKEADRLQQQVKELESRPIDVAVEGPSPDELERIRAQAYEEAKAEFGHAGSSIPWEVLDNASTTFCNTLYGALDGFAGMSAAMDYKQVTTSIDDCISALRDALNRMGALKNNVMVRQRQSNPDAELEDGF